MDKIKELWNKLTKTSKIAIVIVAAVIIYLLVA